MEGRYSLKNLILQGLLLFILFHVSQQATTANTETAEPPTTAAVTNAPTDSATTDAGTAGTTNGASEAATTDDSVVTSGGAGATNSGAATTDAGAGATNGGGVTSGAGVTNGGSATTNAGTGATNSGGVTSGAGATNSGGVTSGAGATNGDSATTDAGAGATNGGGTTNAVGATNGGGVTSAAGATSGAGATNSGVTNGATNDGGSVTTAAPSTPLQCYACADCDTPSEVNKTITNCTAGNNACFMTYNKTSNTVYRGCTDSLDNTYTTCTNAYPGGRQVSDACSFCCTSNNCNSQSLFVLSSACTDLGNSGTVTILASTFLLASLLSLTLSFLV